MSVHIRNNSRYFKIFWEASKANMQIKPNLNYNAGVADYKYSPTVFCIEEKYSPSKYFLGY